MTYLRETVYVKPIEARRFLGLGRRQWEKLVEAKLIHVYHWIFDRRGKPKDRGMVKRADVVGLAGPPSQRSSGAARQEREAGTRRRD